MKTLATISIVGFRLSRDTLYAIQQSSASVEARSFATVQEVRVALRQSQQACVCAEIPPSHDQRALQELELLFAEFARSRFLAFFDSRTSDPVGLARLASTSPTDVVVFDRQSEQAVQLDTVLTRWRSESIADEILRVGQFVLPDELMTIVRRALRLASRPFGLQELAAAALMPERSLRHYCAIRGFLTPQRIIGWTRLLHCAFLLEDEGRTIESIADVLGFASPTALRNQLRDYTGCTASQLRTRGAVNTMARSFEEATLRRMVPA